MSTTLKIARAPLLAVQALGVRRRALVLPEPDGPRSGTGGNGPPLRLLILGDSSAAGVGATRQATALSGQLTQRLQDRWQLTWQLEARTGATTASTLAHLSTLDAAPFDVAVVALGVNDVTRLVSPRRWITLQNDLHRILRTKFGVQRIVRSGLPPMGHFPLLPQPLRTILGRDAKRLDTSLAAICATDFGLTHLPLDLPFAAEYVAEDGFHPSEKAYDHWAEMLDTALAAFHGARALP